MRRVDWQKSYRIIASRHPPIALFERVSMDPAIQDALVKLEMAVNPRLRNEIGQIALVPVEDRVSGPGAGYVMASFTHVNPKGSRFSDGSYGVYYAASDLGTALSETIFHFEEFAKDATDPVRSEDMRVLVGKIDHDFTDISALAPEFQAKLLAPNSYVVARTFAREVRDAGSPGVVYPSVRNTGGECVGAFKPNAVGLPVQERHLQYHWNGDRVDRYFDYLDDRWVEWRGTP